MRRSLPMIVLLVSALVAAGCAADDGSATGTPSPVGATVPTPAALSRVAGTLDGVTNGGGITVSGLGKVTGTPDTLTLSIGVSVLRDSVSDAIDVAAAKADALLTRLRAFGIADEDFQTSNFSIHPEYDWRNDQRRLTGYRVTNQLTVKIRDLDRAGEIVEAAAEEAGDEVVVNGVSFSIEDNEAMIQAARDAAWADAFGKASQLADLAGVALGAPTAITETFSPSPSPLVYAERMAAYDAAATPIEAGSEQVTVSVTVVFAIG
ncbi:MAG: SIMPL domain-containing protein [Acidimicrobiia bacterium]|nr:SIMPL domain-containing protein [Acidimicrobiia bacterium]MBT8214698.1 SIMPL domain-containing protein [Acidimicrobiia bacterium]NNF69305.1 SIMPL domain-containing protein [Acidimicrobiia bacterium]NNK91912.1 SIMPL domain-containing protein [Acidimicrobiia bacterium]